MNYVSALCDVALWCTRGSGGTAQVESNDVKEENVFCSLHTPVFDFICPLKPRFIKGCSNKFDEYM